MRTNPRPNPKSIGFYYPDDYGPYLDTRISSKKRNKHRQLRRYLKPIMDKIVEFNTTRLPNIPPGKMLEIGCASGAFLHKMAQKGWQVQGIEFSSRAAKTASNLGYKVYEGSLESVSPPEGPFDLIVGWMVLEHLHNPVLALKRLRRWIKPGSWLVVSVPNAGSLEFNLFKDKWYALQLPTHLFHFTPRSIIQVLTAGGWSVQRIYHQRVLTNFLASTGYVLQDWGMKSLAKRLINIPETAGQLNLILYPLAFLLGLFGQTGRMTIWARAKE